MFVEAITKGTDYLRITYFGTAYSIHTLTVPVMSNPEANKSMILNAM